MPHTSQSRSLEPATKPAFNEINEFVTTLLATPPTQLTACPGWTAHELVAHLAAGAGEEADLIEAHLAGRPERPTEAFEKREGPYRAMADTVLREQLFEQSLRLASGLGQLGEAAVLFTGHRMTAADFAMHSRSECALHRWDLVGRDDVGWAMLAQPELTRHAVATLTSMPTLQEAPANRLANIAGFEGIRIVLRSEPDDDIVISMLNGSYNVALAPAADDVADLELDAAQRLLVMWGRRDPSSPIQLHAVGTARRLVEALLS